MQDLIRQRDVEGWGFRNGEQPLQRPKGGRSTAPRSTRKAHETGTQGWKER